MTAGEAVNYVKKHGIVLESADGPVPSLAQAVAGGRIRGSWWGHPKGHEIFALTRKLRNSKEILVCRLVDGKVTYVHRRLWPAVVRLADRFASNRLAAIREIHTPTGRHRLEETPYPLWVAEAVRKAAKSMSEAEAMDALGKWLLSHSNR